jgi:acetate kinase
MTDAPPGPHVLALNSGSSSLKFGLYRVGSSQVDTLIAAEAEAIGQGKSRFHAQDARRNVLLSKNISMPDLRDAIVRLAALLVESTMPAALAIGHRIVPGGPKLRRHCLIAPSVPSAIEAAIAFAPLHILLALSAIRVAQEPFPGLPQVACCDTAFHADLADVARMLPIANKLHAQGMQRYGFHRLSCESIVRQLEPPHVQLQAGIKGGGPHVVQGSSWPRANRDPSGADGACDRT